MSSLLNGSFGPSVNNVNSGLTTASTRPRSSNTQKKDDDKKEINDINNIPGVQELPQDSTDKENELRRRRLEKFQNFKKSTEENET